MYFVTVDESKRKQISTFLNQIEEAISWCDGQPLIMSLTSNEVSLKQSYLCNNLVESSMQILDIDADSARHIEQFLSHMSSNGDFREYMRGRVEHIRKELSAGGHVEVVPLKHQYGNYQAFRP